MKIKLFCHTETKLFHIHRIFHFHRIFKNGEGGQEPPLDPPLPANEGASTNNKSTAIDSPPENAAPG